MQLVNIGFGNVVSANKIVSIVSPEAAPIKRIIQEAKDESRNDFHIGGKHFLKKDIAVLATANCSIEFL